ncbi:MAG: hypothetical protein JWR04_2455 [Rhodoglobus sp.]|jgi:hypothetical protein|nr:hypothetical protein [Rhodoglobus sp.]
MTDRRPAPVEATDLPDGARIYAIADLVGMLFFLVLGVVVIIAAVVLRPTNALGIGPGMFPLVSGVLIGGLGLVGTVTRLARIRRAGRIEPVDGGHLHSPVDESETPGEDETFISVNWLRLGLALALIVVFVVVTPILGFVPALALLAFGLTILVARRGWLTSVLVGIGTGALAYYGFGIFLNIHLTGSSLVFLTWLDT